MAARAPLSDELRGGDLGDERLNARRDRVLEALEQQPDAGFPDACGNDGDTEALYRFLRNPRVTLDALIGPHVTATAARCRAVGDVLVIHDTTENAFPGEKARAGLTVLGPRRHGFWLHAALAVSADGLRAPLGILALAPFVRARDRSRTAKPHWRERFHDPHKESRRWAAGVTAVDAQLGSAVRPIHLMDREGDSYELFAHLVERGDRFVVRLNYDRHLIDAEAAGPATVTAARPAGALCEGPITVAARQTTTKPTPLARRRPARAERVAHVCFAAAAVTIKRPRDHQRGPATLALNVVYAWEPHPPGDELPIEWRLVTTEPVQTAAHVLRIVDWYRTRWLIEEFFKCLKTGCAYEKRQLESLQTLLVALGLLAPIAWQLLLMRYLARELPQTRATVALTARQLTILRTTPAGRPLTSRPSIRDALLAVARLGGHLRQNGEPGWLVLARGLQKLLAMETGWAAATAAHM